MLRPASWRNFALGSFIFQRMFRKDTVILKLRKCCKRSASSLCNPLTLGRTLLHILRVGELVRRILELSGVRSLKTLQLAYTESRCCTERPAWCNSTLALAYFKMSGEDTRTLSIPVKFSSPSNNFGAIFAYAGYRLRILGSFMRTHIEY